MCPWRRGDPLEIFREALISSCPSKGLWHLHNNSSVKWLKTPVILYRNYTSKIVTIKLCMESRHPIVCNGDSAISTARPSCLCCAFLSSLLEFLEPGLCTGLFCHETSFLADAVSHGTVCSSQSGSSFLFACLIALWRYNLLQKL